MPDDIVTRLRDVTEMSWDGDEITDPLCGQAADEIERLRRLLHEQNEYSLRLQNELERCRDR
jgi:hypothetical protein